MSLTISPQMRIVAIAGGLAAVAMLGAMFFLLRPPAVADEPAPAIKPLYGGKKVGSGGTTGLAASVSAKAPAAKAAEPKPATATKPAVEKTPAKPAVTKATTPAATKTAKPARSRKPAAAKTQKVAAAAPIPVDNPNGLPLVIARALVDHEVVVVALYNPESHVDQISLGEARAGAEAAQARDPRVGFVALDVLHQGGPLMKKLGVLPDPALFVFRRPGDLALRIDGFVDRDTVAQAALEVAP